MELTASPTPAQEPKVRRRTPQRDAICKYLDEVDGHPSADEVYKALKPDFPSLSLATVYNTLQYLAEEGRVAILGELGDHKIRFDKSTQPHINLACTQCKQIVDFPDPRIGENIAHIEGELGFKVAETRTVYFGLCPKCQSELENENRS